MRQRRGFTLIEVLLSSALVAGMSLAVFLCLSSGLRLWDRTKGLVADEDSAIFFDRFTSDVRNAFLFSTLEVKGSEYSFEFPTIVLTRADRLGARAAEDYIDTLGRVRYEFDAARGEIKRYQADYSRALQKQWDTPRVLAAGIKELQFKYYLPGTKEYTRQVDRKGVIPSGVEVEIRLGADGEGERVLSRFIVIPLGL